MNIFLAGGAAALILGFSGFGPSGFGLSGAAQAANASAPYANVDHRNDAGNDTGNAQVDRLNSGQLDENYHATSKPWSAARPADPAQTTTTTTTTTTTAPR